MRGLSRVLVPLLLVGLAAACSDGSTAPEPVASIALQPAGPLELELEDTARVVATVHDAAGQPLTDRTLTWSSSDASVATVDGSGLVTAVGGGSAVISASAEGRSGSVSVTVDPWKIADNALVIDSTHLQLLSDSTERAAGTYRFQVLQGAAPTIATGTIIVGTQQGGFLRRVTSASVAGGTVTLATDQASLSDVIEDGAVQSTIDLLFAPASRPPAPGGLGPGQVAWGPPIITYLAPGVRLTPTGFDLSGADLCKLVAKAGIKCPKGIAAKVETGTLNFQPHLDVGFEFKKHQLESFHAVAEGDLLLDFDVSLSAETKTTLLDEQGTLLSFKRVFYIQVGWLPIVGYIEGAIDLAAEIKASAKGSLKAGFTDQHTVQAGASWTTAGGWSPVLDHQESFSAREPSLADGTLSGEIDLSERVAVKPDLKIIFYGVAGPFVDVGPFGQASLAFGTQKCDLESQAGVDLDFGFTITVLDPKVGTFTKKIEPWFSWSGMPWNCPLGTLDVSTTTNGQHPDPDGYTLVVDTTHKGAIGPTDQRTLEFIEVGQRQVQLEGVADNCTVDGGATKTVNVITALVTPVQFDIECKTSPQEIYSNDFTAGAGPEWSPATVTQSPSGERFLGAPFGNDTVSLTLTNLPPHDSVVVEFDFYPLETMDGNHTTDPFHPENGRIGPDFLTFGMDGTELRTTTFSNDHLPEHGSSQAYPGNYPDDDYPPGTGADAYNTLGYDTDNTTWGNTIYHLTFTVPHTADQVVFSVAGSGQQGWPNEGWGIDNIHVSTR